MASNENKNKGTTEGSSPVEMFTPEYKLFVQRLQEGRKTFVWKDGDVTVLTVPRSGTHLAWMIARMLVQGSAGPILDPMEESHAWSPAFKDTQTGRRVLLSHVGAAELEDRVLKDGNRKFIYVTRNCKDVSVSQFNFLKRLKIFTDEWMPPIWKDFILRFYNDVPESKPSGKKSGDNQPSEKQSSERSPVTCSWVQQVRAWEDYADTNTDVSILFLYFEHLVLKPEETIRRMSAFLSVPLPEELLGEIVTACKFDNMKNAPVTENIRHLWKEGAEKSFYRKGEVGDWKNWYTVAQNEFADEILAKQMGGSKLTPPYE